MKILHTADWHIGKQLHKVDLIEDHHLFFNWLLEIIKEHNVDLLLISGDIYETSNPSNESLRLYHDFLKRLIKTDTKVVITAGNHDSISQLEATKEVLELLDVRVIGRIGDDYENVIIPFDEDKVVLAAVPFLRDREIRIASEKESIKDKEDAIRRGLAAYFQGLSSYTKETYPDMFKIGMGHLYLQGVSTSDSERAIGNQSGVSVREFAGLFDYLALGHIHKPQIFEDGSIQYSGSPICLSFSERKNNKRVVLLDVNKGKFSYEHLSIPSFRKVKKISGTFEEVREKLTSHKDLEVTLPTLVELEVLEEEYNLDLIIKLQDLINEYGSESFKIVKDRITFRQNPASIQSLFAEGDKIEDLSPEDVFDRKIERSNLIEEDKNLIRSAFREILDTFQD